MISINQRKMEVSSNNGQVNNIEHVLGNGYGNLWLIKLDELDTHEENISISLKIHWDKFELFLHQIHSFFGITIVLLPITLYFINKLEKRREL